MRITIAVLAVAILALSVVPAYDSDDTDAAGKATLTSIVIPEGSGTVRGVGEYDINKTVVAEAVPSEGYRFVEWIDKFTDPKRSFYLDTNKVATAYFEKIPMMSLVVKATEGGEVGGSPSGVYVEGTVVSFYPIAHDGYKFVKWRDGSTDEMRHEVMNSSKTFTAEFRSTAPPNDRVIEEWTVWAILAIFGATAVVSFIYFRLR
jgi:hypothetical protein